MHIGANQSEVQIRALQLYPKDVTAEDCFFAPVLWAVEQGITNGTSPNTFAPNATCTRGQIGTFLYRDLAPANILAEPTFVHIGQEVAIREGGRTAGTFTVEDIRK